jgi:hypothetical protein
VKKSPVSSVIPAFYRVIASLQFLNGATVQHMAECGMSICVQNFHDPQDDPISNSIIRIMREPVVIPADLSALPRERRNGLFVAAFF